MREIRIPVPEGLPESLKMSEAESAAEARFLLAAKLHELGRVSAGSAAELSGLDRMTFLASLARYGMPAINLCGEEITREIEAARKLGKE